MNTMYWLFENKFIESIKSITTKICPKVSFNELKSYEMNIYVKMWTKYRMKKGDKTYFYEL